MSIYYPTTSDVARSFSPDAWVALCYAEYLEDCAVTTLSTQSDMANAIVDETIDTAVADLEDKAEAAAAVLSAEVSRLAEESQIDLETIDREGEEFQSLVSEAYENVQNSEDMLTWKSHLTIDEQVELEASPYDALCALSSTEICISKKEIIDTAATIAATKVPDAIVAYQNGYMDLRKLVTMNILQGIGGANDLVVQKVGGFQDAAGVTIPITADMAASFSVAEIANTLAASAATAFASAGVFRASCLENASDRITQFTNYVRSKGEDLLDQARGAVSTAREAIAEAKFEVVSAFQWYLEMTGLDTVIAAGGDPSTNDFTKYTGSSPISAMSFGVAGTIGKVIGVTTGIFLYGTYEAAKNLLTKAWKWVKEKTDTFVNPIDMKATSNVGTTGSGFVENWTYQTATGDSYTLYFPKPNYMNRGQMQDAANKIASFFNSTVANNGGVCFHFLGGELIIKARDEVTVTIDWGEPSCFEVHVPVTLQFKPACVNRAALKEWLDDNANLCPGGSSLYSSGTYLDTLYFPAFDNTSDLLAFSTAFSNYFTFGDPYIHLTEDVPEKEILLGYECGFWVTAVAVFLTCRCMDLEQGGACGQMYRSWWRSDSSGITATSVAFPNPSQISDVGNKHMIQAVSGWNGDPSTPLFRDHIPWDEMDNVSSTAKLQYTNNWGTHGNVHMHRADLEMIWRFAAAIFVDQRCERSVNPGEYTFLPYSQSVCLFSPADWYIPSDKENINVALVAAAALATVGLVIVGYFLVGKIMRVFKAKGFQKWNAIKGPLDNKQWNSKVLTKAEQKLYLKASCKLDAIGDIFQATGGGIKGLFSRITWPVRAAASMTRTAISKVSGLFITDRSADTTCADPSRGGPGVVQQIDDAINDTVMPAVESVSDDVGTVGVDVTGLRVLIAGPD